ncbi:MAG: methylmalonyl Co-A mutase-associated GTPase MeaB [candidate division Zixibacteria bacterium]|nr:methylmalonyl Co-A mutase-associated GTPase MeaB [candidate division Zixibacteria bacterium]
MTLLEKFKSGDIQALAQLISHIENQKNSYQKVLDSIYSKTGRAYKIGITGPPGVGKSSLVDGLVQELVKQNQTLGVIAVDPTSPFSGGAFLGDRVRMQSHSGRNGVYIRSMASRGSWGGLAATTFETCLVLDAFGKEFIILETVGVGQIELEIAQHSDTVAVILSPESGDSIQALKAGLMEIADIFVVNKSDREGASRLVAQLNMSLNGKRKAEEWHYPVISTSVSNGTGIDLFWEKIQQHKSFLIENDLLAARRKSQLKNHLKKVIENKLKQSIVNKLESDEKWEQLVGEVYLKKISPYSAADKILASA